MVKWDEGTSTAIEELHEDLLPEPAEGGETTTGDDKATGIYLQAKALFKMSLCMKSLFK